MNFKSNSISQNWHVRWELHPSYILWIGLISSQYRTSNTSHHAEVYSSRAWNYKFGSGTLAARQRVEQNV